MLEQSVHTEVYSTRFNRLLGDLLGGNLRRNCFQRWEIDLLLDIESCPLRSGAKRQALRRYQRAINRQFERGGGKPITLTEYLNQPRRQPN